MKKYISLMAIAIVAFLASCSNDDITVGTSYTFNVNASGVVSGFIEATKGELEKFDNSDEKLRIRVLIYNDNGELVAKETGYFSNYNTQLKTVKNLSSGKYTVIGISDVVSMNGSTVDFEWWKLSGESKLSEMKIEDLGYMGYSARILGVARYPLVIGDNQSGSLNVDLKPAGALVYSIVWNTGAYSTSNPNLNKFCLCANKSSEALSYDDAGDYVITESYDSESWWKIVETEATDDSQNIYWYNYILPMKNLNLYYRCDFEDGTSKTFDFASGTTTDIKAGGEYVAHLDLYNWNDYYKTVTSSDAFDYPGSTNNLKSPQKSKVLLDKKGKMPKDIFSQLNHVLKASDI